MNFLKDIQEKMGIKREEMEAFRRKIVTLT